MEHDKLINDLVHADLHAHPNCVMLFLVFMVLSVFLFMLPVFVAMPNAHRPAAFSAAFVAQFVVFGFQAAARIITAIVAAEAFTTAVIAVLPVRIATLTALAEFACVRHCRLPYSAIRSASAIA